ncbi:MAG TPA: type VI secretion system baseplate subunit TssK [Planctomycetaceae bacterium]|nr:type VI secretion system baseplate subunit TssK [Planctomycetaceae bacterium]
MRHLQVNWHEGLFLRPHHLQASERHSQELMAVGALSDHPLHYGLQQLTLSESSIQNHRVEVQQLRARLRDGTLVDVGNAGSLVVERDRLLVALDRADTVQVLLAVPQLRMGPRNLGTSSEGMVPRYVEQVETLSNENEGGDDQPVSLRLLNVRLLLSSEDASGFETLPIARIRRGGDRESLPQIDRSYIPPVVALDVCPELGTGLVRSAFDLIGRKIEVLSQQVRNRGISLDAQNPGDLERILMLGELNRAMAVLRVLAFSRGVHPLWAYTELCGAVGSLSLFGKERRTEELAGYDHENLGPIFRDVVERLRMLVETVRELDFQKRPFIGRGQRLCVTMEPQWFHSTWQWFVGVNKGDLSESDCRRLLSEGLLDWKLGSERMVEQLFRQRAEGLSLVPLQRLVRSLPMRPEWIYFEVPRNDRPAWKDVLDTQTLALMLRDSLILNKDQLQGQETLEINFEGRRVSLQFALFAVQQKS